MKMKITKLHGLINETGIRQNHVAKKTGIDSVTISRYKTGERKMTAVHKAAIAKFFKVDEGDVE